LNPESRIFKVFTVNLNKEGVDKGLKGKTVILFRVYFFKLKEKRGTTVYPVSVLQDSFLDRQVLLLQNGPSSNINI